MSRYRKLYNANILGTTDISILKFYYASFKIQQENRRISDIGEFLDSCIKTATETSRYFKIWGFLPFIGTQYSTELKRIAKFIELRRKDVEALFLKDEITDEDVEKLLYGIQNEEKTTMPEAETTPPDLSESLEKAKQYILKCYSINRKKQLGDRIFGYLVKSEVIEAHTPADRLTEWNKLVENQYKPSDTRLHGNPKFNRCINRKDITALMEHLETLKIFFEEIGFSKTAEVVRRDIDKIKEKN